MSASDWDTQVTKLREVMRLWEGTGDVKRHSADLASPILELHGVERTRFWRQPLFSEKDRTVRLLFEWRDPDTSRGNRDWQQIELVAKSQPTPWANLAMLVAGLNAVRLSFTSKRANTRVLLNVLNQMWPPERGGAPRIVYRDRIVYQRTGAHPEGSPYAALRVDEGAPYEVCKAAYRALCLKLGAHPDVGGSHETQKALNSAWEQIDKVYAAGGRAS